MSENVTTTAIWKQINHLEAISMTALPAQRTAYLGGWVLRFSAGFTRRGNAVHPLYGMPDDLLGAVVACETRYAAHGLPTIFKLTPAIPPALEALLRERGYAQEAGASVQVASVRGITAVEGLEIAPALTEEWLAAYFRLNERPLAYLPIMRDMLTRIPCPAGFAALRHDGRIAALGLGVADGDHVGLFDIATDPTLRRQGLGRRLVQGILHWGAAAGAAQAYLQVLPTNTPALNLYAQLGFAEVYPYTYFTRPNAPL